MSTIAKELPPQVYRNADGRIQCGFVIWQAVYASYGRVTFPVAATKRPMVRGYQKVGPDLSRKWGQVFPSAPGVGLLCGPKSGITELDVDTKEERVLADALDRHGQTPIVIRTASGKYKAWYRHNGERRRIRPWPGVPLDVLGVGGFTVAPPSFNTEYRQYEIIAGKLDDFDHLPAMRNAPEPKPAATSRLKPTDESLADSPLADMREGDGRNVALYYAIGRPARDVHAVGGTKNELLEVARRLNAECAEPMTAPEVSRVVDNVWSMTIKGLNHIGQHGAFMQDHEIDDLIGGNQDAFVLLAYLRRHEQPLVTFWIANGLADHLGWTVKRLANARKYLIDRKLVRQIKTPSQGNPAIYGWPGQGGQN